MKQSLPPGPLIVGIDGVELTGESRQWLAHPAVGGVILFARNYRDPDQLRALCEKIRRLRSPPLLICVDQEGGRVQRFRSGFTPLPPLAVLGRWHANRPDRARDLAYRHGRVMAAEVLGHGVDLSLAPVLDLGRVSSVIGDRAISADPDVVAELAEYYVAGMNDAGMAACGKHFPGHGSVGPDSHDQVVVDARERPEIEPDLAPFRALAGTLAAVMPAHVCYGRVDELPAGFSPVWIGEVLRAELEFAGTVISDDLDMAGAGAAGDLPARLDACLAAGCDLALVCRPQSVRELLAGGLDLPPDRTAEIATLYGRAAFSLAEQLTVPEFRTWRDSMRSLAESDEHKRR